MKRERHTIINEGTIDDITVTLTQFGKRIVITTERPGVASSVLRDLVKHLTKNEDKKDGEKENAVGFSMD